MQKLFSKLTAAFLAVLMLVSMVPAFPVSAAVTGSKFENAQLDIVSDKESTLAPGVTLNQMTVYDKNGDQVKMFITTADMSVDTVKLYASYKDMDPTNYGMSKLTEQVAAFNEKAAAGDEYYQGTVVAGINSSYYNMTTGKPTGTFVMNGIDVTTESEGNAYGYFAVMKDGTYKIGNKGDYSKDKGNIQEAIGIYTMLIVDGEICSGLNATTKYPRQTIGLTADNKVILMTADGNQAPTSIGLTIQEQAEVMLDLGCVWAGHLDGGGSCTYASKPEGSDDFVITNSPSDGSERSVSNGFIIVSTEVASYEFDHVLYSADNNYVTPGTSVNVAVNGTSSTGHAADIPEGVTYETTNGTYADGVFTAGSAIGDATITAIYNGNEIGTQTIHVVNPQTVSFANATVTVPYGKTAPLNVKAFYGLNTVTMKPSDFTVSLSDAALGTVNGFDFTACEETADAVTGGTVTVTLNADAAVTATATISLGKGSEVVQSFESGVLPAYTIKTGYPQYGPMGSNKDANGNYYYNGQNELGELYIVTAANGQVHDGTYAMAVECDFSQAYETGYHQLSLTGLGIVAPAKAQTIGMWIYLPELEELYTSSMRFVGKTTSGTTVSSPWLWDNCQPYSWNNSGWQWFSMDISGWSEDITFSTIQIYICDRDNTTLDEPFYFADHASVNGKFTYYFDSVTLDYSSVVDDREAPVFSAVRYADTTMPDAVELNGQTITNNVVSFGAVVAENTAKNNYTGLNEASLKAFVDGVEVTSTYAAGIISVDALTLADGIHTIRFEAADNMGNLSYIERQITINADSDIPTISIVPQNPNADKILIGSLYWVDLVADNAQNVSKVTVDFNLNSMSQWELDHMIVTAGFKATYVYDEINNNATITVEKIGEVAADATVLVQIPIRTWESRLTEYEGYEAQTPEKLWSRKIIWPVDIKLSANYGAVEFTDGTTGSFSMAPLAVITELYGNYAELNANGDYSNKTSWHIHTAAAIDDKANTCTENGYTGRTYCDVCDSVVDWGTTLEATGHTYEVADGVVKCACGDLFNGVYTDGKTYVDGVVADGWNNDSYYVDGIALTGVQLVEGYYYDFGEDGVCANQVKFTGIFYDDSVSAYRYSKLGELTGGWNQIGEDWYYFESLYMYAVPGTYKVGKATFTFNEMGMTEGAWYTSAEGTRFYYGPSFYRATNPGYMKLVEIDGVTYNFDRDGYITPGIWALRDSTAMYKRVFEFAQDGSLIRAITDFGVVACDDAVYYINAQGVVPINANLGLVKVGDDHYYVLPSGKVAQDSTRWITADAANGLVEPGEYYFEADGKMEKPYTGIKTVDGVDYYYLNGSVMTNSTGLLVKVDDDIYYVTPMGKIKKSFTAWITATKANGLVEPGEYTFGADGKMEKPYTGIKTVDGVDYYYLNGNVMTNSTGLLVKVDDDIYYVTPMGKIKKSFTAWITATKANGLVEPGEYTFGADGKMEKPYTGIKTVDGVDYYYLNGVVMTNDGGKLVKVDDDIYYVTPMGKIKKSFTAWITATKANGLVQPGEYTFGADGKMEKPYTGIKNVDGVDYYYLNGVVMTNNGGKLVEWEGDIYYVTPMGKIKKDFTAWITATKANGLVVPGEYTFAADGKML